MTTLLASILLAAPLMGQLGQHPNPKLPKDTKIPVLRTRYRVVMLPPIVEHPPKTAVYEQGVISAGYVQGVKEHAKWKTRFFDPVDSIDLTGRLKQLPGKGLLPSDPGQSERWNHPALQRLGRDLKADYVIEVWMQKADITHEITSKTLDLAGRISVWDVNTMNAVVKEKSYSQGYWTTDKKKNWGFQDAAFLTYSQIVPLAFENGWGKAHPPR